VIIYKRQAEETPPRMRQNHENPRCIIQLSLLALQERNPNALAGLQYNFGLQAWVTSIDWAHVVLEPVEGLKEAHDRIAHFGESKLLSNTDTRATVKCWGRH
jgi:hypothetical protein